MCVDRKVCTRTVRTGHELQTAFHLRKFFKSSKEKYCVSFSIQARDNSSFHESSGGMGWGSSENKRDRAGERGKISCFALASHCSHSLPYFPQHSFT